MPEQMDQATDSSDHLSLTKTLVERIDWLIGEGYRAKQSEILESLRSLATGGDPLGLLFDRMQRAPELVEMIGAQCFLLYSMKNSYARLNFWLPKRERHAVIKDRFQQYFSIDVLHNHSFDFFTVGILGPGYESQFYRLDDDIDAVKIGQRVGLVKTENLTLSRGHTLFVPKSTAFHVQHEPVGYSVSLNIIPKRFDDIGSAQNRQIIVDPQTMMVERIFDGAVGED